MRACGVASVRGVTSERLIGGLSFTESNDLSLVETYCFLSIITIAIEVISSIKKNTPKSDSIILIISSIINIFGYG